MRNRPLAMCALTLAFFCLTTAAIAKTHATKKPANPPLTLKVGSMAPDFTLFAFDGKELKKVSLHDFRGKKNVSLAFYVFAFTGG